jgi:peptide/nickel transport system substrate-binding protein
LTAHTPASAHRAATRALSPALAACSSVKKGGTFVYGVDQDVVNLDAHNTQDNGSLWADMNIYDQLVRIIPEKKAIVPDLATSWDTKNGGRVLTFHLRHNAKFSDGTPVTAQDVQWSYDRVRQKSSVNSWSLSAVKSDKALNTYTFQVTLKQPWAPFLNDITLWGASIYSRKAFQKEGATKWRSHPVASGPFMVSQYKPGQYTLLKANPYYWEKDACGNKLPYLNAVKLVYLPSDNTRLTQLEAKSIDAMIDLPYNLQASVNTQPGLKALTTPEYSVYAVSLNMKKVAAFKDRNVVQAMNYAVDRNAMVKTVFFGHATAAGSPIDKGILYWTGKYGYSYNLAKAKALMAKSKFPKGFKTTLLISSGNTNMNGIAVIMQSQLKAIGIQMTIRPVDSTTEFQLQQKETYQMVMGAGTSDNIDPNENMEFCCINNGGADAGYTGWKDTQADALYAKSQAEQNTTKRAQELARWQQMVMERGPFMWLIYPTNSFAYRTNVHNFTIKLNAQWPLWTVWKS